MTRIGIDFSIFICHSLFYRRYGSGINLKYSGIGTRHFQRQYICRFICHFFFIRPKFMYSVNHAFGKAQITIFQIKNFLSRRRSKVICGHIKGIGDSMHKGIGLTRSPIIVHDRTKRLPYFTDTIYLFILDNRLCTNTRFLCTIQEIVPQQT